MDNLWSIISYLICIYYHNLPFKMSSGFITETEASDIRKRKQEEWERVRKADDPMG